MAQQSVTGPDNQGFPLCQEHAVGDMDPVRELPYGPAASGAASEAGQMAASDNVPRPPNKPLASYGASTDGKRTDSFWRNKLLCCRSANGLVATARMPVTVLLQHCRYE